MRVERPNGTSAVASGKSVRRSGSDAFTLSEGEAASSPTANAGIRSIGGIDILIALQGIEEPGKGAAARSCAAATRSTSSTP